MAYDSQLLTAMVKLALSFLTGLLLAAPAWGNEFTWRCEMGTNGEPFGDTFTSVDQESTLSPVIEAMTQMSGKTCTTDNIRPEQTRISECGEFTDEALKTLNRRLNLIGMPHTLTRDAIPSDLNITAVELVAHLRRYWYDERCGKS